MRLDLSILAALTCFSVAVLPEAAQADDDADIWEEKDGLEDEDEDDEEYQNSLYDSPTWTYSNEQHQVVYDAEGATGRRVRVLARLSDAPGERPVLLISHGGSEGKNNPNSALVRWSEYFAEHGYHVITLAHEARSPAQRAALCVTFDVPEGPNCSMTHGWGRPHDVEQVLDFIEDRAAGAWSGRFDLDNIGMMGHSAGASGTFVTVGGTREIGVRTLDKSDARVKAAVTASPAGILQGNGIDEGTWQGVEVPVLILTGSQDYDAPIPSADYRLDPLRGLDESEDSRVLFFESAGATHSFFALNARQCRNAVGDVVCREMADAMQSTALAHFDAYLTDDNTAKDWLEDEVVDEVTTPGLADLTTREDIEGFTD